MLCKHNFIDVREYRFLVIKSKMLCSSYNKKKTTAEKQRWTERADMLWLLKKLGEIST